MSELSFLKELLDQRIAALIAECEQLRRERDEAQARVASLEASLKEAKDGQHFFFNDSERLKSVVAELEARLAVYTAKSGTYDSAWPPDRIAAKALADIRREQALFGGEEKV